MVFFFFMFLSSTMSQAPDLGFVQDRCVSARMYGVGQTQKRQPMDVQKHHKL